MRGLVYNDNGGGEEGAGEECRQAGDLGKTLW